MTGPAWLPFLPSLLATAVPMKPLLPNTVTVSPEKEDRPPRPRFIAAVLRSRGRTWHTPHTRLTRGATGLSSITL